VGPFGSVVQPCLLNDYFVAPEGVDVGPRFGCAFALPAAARGFVLLAVASGVALASEFALFAVACGVAVACGCGWFVVAVEAGAAAAVARGWGVALEPDTLLVLAATLAPAPTATLGCGRAFDAEK